jgi:hypothetical protein
VEKTKYSVTKSVLIENSSNVAAVAYTDIGALLVTFKGGSQYIYKHVPEEVYEEMTKTESAGKYLNVNIKGKYEFEKIEENKPKNSVEITIAEVLASVETDDEQAVLQILKDKGAPINGTFLLEADNKNYNWTREENPLKNVLTFTWTKK